MSKAQPGQNKAWSIEPDLKGLSEYLYELYNKYLIYIGKAQCWFL